jgi:iron complex outermembrane recepter protein
MFKKTRMHNAVLLALGGGMALTMLPATVQAQAVVITGSSIKQIEGAGALPVQTITRADIERTGVQTTEQLLATVSAMSSSGASTNAQSASAVGTLYGLAGVSLRGLGQDRTLVMVNGQRLAAYAGGGGAAVNVNNIPLAAIERVEILKDGASAVYGSDAVAGVINFILQKNFQGIQIGGTYGTPTASGGGQQYQANVVAGFGDLTKDKFNITGSVQWNKNQDLLATDRSFSKTGNNPPYYESLATGSANIQGAWNLNGGDPGRLNGVTVPLTNPAFPAGSSAGYVGGGPGGGYGNPLAAAGRCGDIKMSPNPTPTRTTINRTTDPATQLNLPYCNYDSAADVGLLSATETVSATLNGVWQISNQVEAYGDLLWSRTISNPSYQPSPLRTNFMQSDEEFVKQGVDPVLLLRQGSSGYATAANYLQSVGLGDLAGQDLGMTLRVFDFGRRTNEDTSTQSRLVGGVRGEFMNQSYDVSAFWNESKLEGTVTDGYFSMVGFARATQDPANDWNPFVLTQSQAFQNAIASAKYVGPTLDGTSESYGLQAVISGDVTPLPAGQLQYAAGYQFRRESFVNTPAPALLSGDISGLGGATKPVDQGRTINALFGELNIPVVKNLDANLALRWDDYSDFGSTTNWKGNIRWQPTEQLLFRGSYGTGFRAPTLTDLYQPIVFGNQGAVDDPVAGADQVEVNGFSGGNPRLQAETSTQWALGFVVQPLKTLAFGVDYFNIRVNDTVAQPTVQEVVDQAARGNPTYTPLVIRDPVTQELTSVSAPLLNTGKMEVSGVDLNVGYRETLGPGVLSVGLQGTYYFDFTQTSPGGTVSKKFGTVVDSTGAPVLSSTAGLEGIGVVLRYKQYLAATWAQNDWAVTLANNYATGYHAGWDLNDNPTRIGASSLWDLQLSYSGIKNTVLTLGARNIFDTQPDTYVDPTGGWFAAGYDPSQYDPRGRFIYLTGTFKF